MLDLRLFVGLGNPGKNYEYSRHNLGFLVVRHLARRLKAEFVLCSFAKGVMAVGISQGIEFYLFLPFTYMNNSGMAVREFIAQKELGPQNILVICDDLNLDFGQMRLKSQGSDGGHNGLGSIIQQLGTEEFARLRLGIGAPPQAQDAQDYVLEGFNDQERSHLDEFIKKASECCFLCLNSGIDKAMEQHNRRSDVI